MKYVIKLFIGIIIQTMKYKYLIYTLLLVSIFFCSRKQLIKNSNIPSDDLQIYHPPKNLTEAKAQLKIPIKPSPDESELENPPNPSKAQISDKNLTINQNKDAVNVNILFL